MVGQISFLIEDVKILAINAGSLASCRLKPQYLKHSIQLYIISYCSLLCCYNHLLCLCVYLL